MMACMQTGESISRFLVRLGYFPNEVSGQMAHYMAHLLHLLNVEDEEALISYYGLFGHERLALDDIAKSRNMPPENMIAVIDNCLHKLEITPEWQMMKSII